MTTTRKTSRSIVFDANTKASQHDWGKRHRARWHDPTMRERPIVELVRTLALIADNHFARFESTIGNDGVLGDAWADIARGALALLNGEIGALDSGTVDGMIRDMMAHNNVDPDTGDLFWGNPKASPAGVD